MSNPCIICVAITGSLPPKTTIRLCPSQLRSKLRAPTRRLKRGPALCTAMSAMMKEDPHPILNDLRGLKEGLEKHCPGLIIQLSTGGRSGAGKDRGGMLPLRPDMASLSAGSKNFPTRVYENPPDLVDWLASEMLAHNVKPEIEAFDLSHIVQAATMQKDGRLKSPLYVQFVMGVKNAMPA
jgi:3-keto-5-aminohexanoate cleavage enzyme